MPRKRRERAKKARARGNRMHMPVAPGLFKETVVLTDTAELSGSQIIGNGFNVAYLSANGFSNPDLVGSYRVPQERIWNQYAAMYDFYQVEEIHMEFYPYKWELTSSVTGVSPLNARPTYSCVDPESIAPTTASGIASYGNLRVTPAYATHKRSLPYTMLGIQKQDSVILATGGSAASRAQYNTPAQINALIQSPNFAMSPIGTCVFTIKYCFSGRRAPNVALPQTISSCTTVVSEDGSRAQCQPQGQDPEIMVRAYENLLKRMGTHVKDKDLNE